MPFLRSDREIRTPICTTNAIESLNARFRRPVRARGHVPTEHAALKHLYLVTISLDRPAAADSAGVTAGRPSWLCRTSDYLRRRREEAKGALQQLLREIRERGYPGSSNLLVRYINQGRLGPEHPHIAPRKATRILLTNPENLPGDQRETAGRPSAACPQMKALTTLIGKSGAMLDPVPPTRTGSWNGSPAPARRTSRTRTRSPAASSPASRPPPQPSRSRTTTAAPKASKQDENDQTADVRTRRLRTPPSPDTSRVRLRNATTGSARRAI